MEHINDAHFNPQAIKGRDHLEKYICKPKNNIKLDHKGTVFECVNYIHLFKNGNMWRASTKTITNLQVLKSATNIAKIDLEWNFGRHGEIYALQESESKTVLK
jgi:glycine cleavage system protein P-like pyridoxal-binding family